MTNKLPPTRVLRHAGWRANLELCASIQIQCWLTVLCSETRPNAKPQNVIAQCKSRRTNGTFGFAIPHSQHKNPKSHLFLHITI